MSPLSCEPVTGSLDSWSGLQDSGPCRVPAPGGQVRPELSAPCWACVGAGIVLDAVGAVLSGMPGRGGSVQPPVEDSWAGGLLKPEVRDLRREGTLLPEVCFAWETKRKGDAGRLREEAEYVAG